MEIAWKERIARELPEAFELDRLVLHYQPIVRLDNPTVVQVEALVRWPHPEYGELVAGMFIPSAADLGMLSYLDRWTLERACAEAAQWNAMGRVHPELALSINIAPEEFQTPNFVNLALGIISDAGFRPGCVVLEISEAGRLTDPDLARWNLKEIRSCGVRIAIDDFGCKQSLSHYHRLPADQLKLDGTLVRGIARDDALRGVVEAVAEMACAESTCVVAEGVETSQELEAVRKLGCTLGQGFYIARPMPGQQLLDFLDRVRSMSAADRRKARRSRSRFARRQGKEPRSPTASLRPPSDSRRSITFEWPSAHGRGGDDR